MTAPSTRAGRSCGAETLDGAPSSSGGGPLTFPSRARFVGHVLALWTFGLAGVGLSLAAGAWGYQPILGAGCFDTFFNSAKILSGTGPAAEMPNDTISMFTGILALPAGLVWTALLSVVLFPFTLGMRQPLHLRMPEEDL